MNIFNFLSFACGIATTLVIRIIYSKFRLKYRRYGSVVDMDQIDGSVVHNRVVIGSVNTNNVEEGDAGENTFYRRTYDGLGEVF